MPLVAFCRLHMKQRINVRLAEPMVKALAIEAKREETSIAQIIRRAVRAYLWPQKKAA